MSKTALVTGTTSGIGREIVRGLIDAGYSVVAHARSAEKAAAEKAKLNSDRIHTVLADLSLPREVRRLANEITERFPKIDCIVHNAAVVPKTRVEIEGLEAAFATNVLAPFILTRQLQGALRAAAPSRVVYFWGGGKDVLDVDDLQSKKTPFDGWATYCQTKNACALLAQESARRFAKDKISVFAVLPGLVDTEGMRGLDNLFSKLGRLFFRTPVQGARTPLWVVTEPGLESSSGKCFGSLLGSGWRNEMKLSSHAADSELASRVYAACEKLADAI